MAAFVAAGKGFKVKDGIERGLRIPAGVAPNAKLIICRIANRSIQYKWEYIIKALEKLIEIKEGKVDEQKMPKGMRTPKEWGVDVISMSFGKVDEALTEDYKEKMEDLMAKLNLLKVILVAAAGNYGNTTCTLFPANHDNVFSVGALDIKYNKPAEFNPKDVKVYAPGVDIAVPLVTKLNSNCAGVKKETGTSCAAPAIAGLVALKIQFERNKPTLLNNSDDDHHIRQILGQQRIRFSDMKKMFKQMETDPREKPHVLDPCNYFQKECRLNIE